MASLMIGFKKPECCLISESLSDNIVLPPKVPLHSRAASCVHGGRIK